MKRRNINIILFLIFLIEGSIFRYLFPDITETGALVSPRFVLASIILISIFVDKKYALFLGLLFGLLYDLIYGGVLGLYTVGMAGIGYFSGWFIQFLHPTFLVFVLIEFIGLLAFELFIYSMLSLYQLVEMPIEQAFTHFMFPSVIFNLLFAIIIYLPVNYLLARQGADD